LSSASVLATSVKIGVLTDLSGSTSDMSGSGSVVAARMAVQDFLETNQALKVEVISADHQNKPDVASNISRGWIGQEGVTAIVDVPSSSAALAVNEIVRSSNAVFIAATAGTSDLTGKACTPHTIHWAIDTWALAHSTARAVVEDGGKSWFFITADYAFGHTLESEASAVIKSLGGEVKGRVRHPFPTADLSSHLLQAQASGAKVIGLANAGGDMIASVRQAHEFGITKGGHQVLASMIGTITDVHALGLETAQGLLVTEAFYWDLNDDTRKWSARFEKEIGRKPTMMQAGVYAGILHYLKAVDAAKSSHAGTVVTKMKELPTEDKLFGPGKIRMDGRKIHDVYLFRVKAPARATGPWDYYEKVRTVPGEQAFRPLHDGNCPLVK
jgi:branched-chain amino acid transport system substrate-binding protein